MAAPSAKADEKAETKDHKTTEIGAFPLIGGSSDIGFGGGAVGSIAHFTPGEQQYRWRVELSGIITYNPSGGLSHIPYTDVYVKYTIRDMGRGVRLELRPSYTHESTLRYYGMGNASVRDPSLDKGTYNEYGRTHPTMQATVRLPLIGGMYVRLSNYFTYNTFVFAQNSKLEQDLQANDPELRKLLDTPKSHAVDFFEYALVYDTRDDETIPKRGQYHEAWVRYSPGGTGFFPYRYEQFEGVARWYYTFAGDKITVAARGVFDLQLDNPPFYELARFEDTYALGGSKGVRGVPAQRYYGKVKAFGNLEGRWRIFPFHLFGNHLDFGVAAFFDAGRVWADINSHRELDGTGLGLKWGTGGGLRLQQGSTFLVRLDLAWSPDAHPIGGYFGAGEMF
ncbi:MAG TPA: BamA/TamA family outer membrane protein [Polyangiaceae bacterium]|nr:BamA/TamA family outer membrane protein [Polyangiaceae bacterium]